MSCLIPFLEAQIALLQEQLKNTALSHDMKGQEIIALEAKVAQLEERLNPPPPMMSGTVVDHDPVEKVSPAEEMAIEGDPPVHEPPLTPNRK